MSTPQHRYAHASGSCRTVRERQAQDYVAMLPVVALGCVLATLAAEADLNNKSSQIGVTPWGTSLQQVLTEEPAAEAHDVIGARVRVEPGDCLIIASTDRNSLSHAVSVNWRTADSGSSKALSTGHSDLAVETIYLTDTTSIKTQQSCRASRCGRLRGTINLPVAGGSDVQTTRLFRVPILDHPPRQLRASHSAISERVCEATCLAVTDRLTVYSTDPSMPKAVATTVTASLTSVILDEVEQRIGPVADLDTNGSLTVVLSRLTTTHNDNAEPVFGCVRPADYFRDDTMSGDIVYLDPRVIDSEAFAAVLAHELTHAAVFSRLRQLQDSGVAVRMLPSWLNEAVAHKCERDLFPGSPNLSGRIKSWRDDTGRWPVMPNDRRSDNVSTRGPERAAGLMFVSFLTQRRSLRDLVDSVALGTESTLDGSDETFARKFRAWTVWMARQHGPAICRTPAEAGPTQTLRGTAARWYRVEAAGEVTVQSDTSSLLQVTLLKATLKTPEDERS